MIFFPKHLRVYLHVALFFRPVHEYVFWVSTPHVCVFFFHQLFSCMIFPVCTLPTISPQNFSNGPSLKNNYYYMT